MQDEILQIALSKCGVVLNALHFEKKRHEKVGATNEDI